VETEGWGSADSTTLGAQKVDEDRETTCGRSSLDKREGIENYRSNPRENKGFFHSSRLFFTSDVRKSLAKQTPRGADRTMETIHQNSIHAYPTTTCSSMVEGEGI
jgi:hypothetical protein